MTPTAEVVPQTGSAAFRAAVYGNDSPDTTATETPAAGNETGTSGETATPAQPDTAAAQGTDPAAQTTPDANSDLEALIQQAASRMGLDLNDPSQRKTAKSFADKELYIRQLEGQLAASKPADESYLTEFERGLGQVPEPTPAQPVTPAAQPPSETQPSQPQPSGTTLPPYLALSQGWNSEADAYAALNKAVEAGDPVKTWDVETAMFMRRANNLLIPMIQQQTQRMVEQLIGQQLGDVIPEVRQTVQERRSEQNRDFALAELRKTMGDVVDGMFNEEGGQPIRFDGREFPNTAVNRILAQNPELLQINVLPNSPEAQAASKKLNISPQDAAERLTYIQRYRAIGRRVAESRGTTPQAAQQLLRAGQTMAERAQQDSIRQGLNSGAGATVTNGQPGQEDYVSQIMTASRGGRKSLSDLMSQK